MEEGLLREPRDRVGPALGPLLTLALLISVLASLSLRSWAGVLGSGPKLLGVCGVGREIGVWGAFLSSCGGVCLLVCGGCCLGVSGGGPHACFQTLHHWVRTGLCVPTRLRDCGL